MADVTIRDATLQDAAGIAAIYNHYVRTSTATFDTEEKSTADRERWLAERGADHPVVVALDGERLVAWGSLSPWGTRCAYRHTVEISVYVSPDSVGSGVGPEVCRELLGRARALGHHAVVSQVVSENEPSIKMGERLGFVEAGRLSQVGRKFDRWLDLVLMQLVLEESS